MSSYSTYHPLPIAILISGHGSNLQALMDAIEAGLPAKICVVVSNRPDAYGLERARRAGIATEVLPHQGFKDRAAYDQALMQCLDRYQPVLIVLAGFMRILGADFIQHFQNRILNIHPSLLPKYPGLNTHAEVLASGEKVHGATVHVVTEQLDRGPIIAQAALSVEDNEDAISLKNRIHTLEHQLYPAIIALYAQGRLAIQPSQVLLDGHPLPPSGLKMEFSNLKIP